MPRTEWSCEGCGKPSKDAPSECECGIAVCQVCWHTAGCTHGYDHADKADYEARYGEAGEALVQAVKFKCESCGGIMWHKESCPLPGVHAFEKGQDK